MKNFKKLSYLFFALIIGLMLSCQGPEGPQGPPGTANVIYSDWITPTWSEDNFYGTKVQKYDISENELTQDVFDHGVVLVYWKNYANDVWQLPTIADILYFDFKIRVNHVILYYFLKDNTNNTPFVIPSSNKFRYVIIPGGQHASNSSKQSILEHLSQEGVDVKNYYDVCAYYKIEP